MKYKTLFRLLVKAVGLVVFAFGLPQVVMIASFALDRTFPIPTIWLQLAGAFLQVAVGLYLFFGGKWIVNLAIPGNRPYCPECAYDLTGTPVGRCPECGTAFRWEDVNPKTEVQSPKVEN